MARFSYKHRPRVHTVWHSPKRNIALMLNEVREATDRGEVAQIVRAGGKAFQIVKNDARWLTRTSSGEAVATTDTVAEAVQAGDQHLEWLPRVDGDDFPRGAA